jgi:hypothetical protein
LTIIISLVGVVSTILYQLFKEQTIPLKYGIVTKDNEGLRYIITFTVYFIGQVSLWFFLIWSLTFTAYVSYISFRSSTIFASPLTTRSFRWLQLGSATLFPILIFTVLWNLASAEIPISDPEISILNFAIILFLSILVAIFLFAVNNYIPEKMLSPKLAFYSILLFASVILSFASGYTFATHVALFGFLLYFTVDAKKIESMVEEIALYDLEDSVYSKVKEIIASNNRIIVNASEAVIRRQTMADRQNQFEQEKINSDLEVMINKGDKLADIERKRVSLIDKINSVVIKDHESKIALISKAAEILAQAHLEKTSKEHDDMLTDITTNSGSYTREDIERKLSEIISIAGNNSTNLPDNVEKLKQIVNETLRIQKQEVGGGERSYFENIKDMPAELRERMILEIRNESRVTHKIKIVADYGFNRDSGWTLLRELGENIRWNTYMFEWDKLEVS